MKKLYFLLVSLLIGSVAFSQPIINEVDADQSGTDMSEFIELLGMPNESLNGYVVVLFNGSDDASYAAYDLDGFTTDSNGFFILANSSLAQAGDIDLGASNIIQNGADAVAIYTGDDTDFPNDTPATTTNLVDALVYGTSDPDDTDLLTALGETTQYNDTQTESIQWDSVGMDYVTQNPTFRADNSSPTCDLSITGNDVSCDAVTGGTDPYTATFDFTGGGTSLYTITAESNGMDVSGDIDLSAGDPDTDATGTITVNNLSEGNDVTLTIIDAGVCNLMDTATSPTCEPALTLPLTENFTYTDGSLVPNGGWANHSGTLGDMMVTSGQVLVQHGTPSEDANLAFTPVAGNLYFGIDVTVNDPGGPISGADNEYFAHFKDSGFGFFGRLDIVAPIGGGDFTFGISTDTSTAQATWATDLTYGVTYRVIVRYDQDNNIAEMWVDATLESDTSILGTDQADPGNSIESFALRQSDSAENEGVLVDNLVVSQNFSDTTLSTNNFETTAFGIYPNPNSNGVLNISVSNGETFKVAIYDLLGKEVISEDVTNNTLDISNLRSGLYLVKLSQGNSTATKKLIIK